FEGENQTRVQSDRGQRETVRVIKMFDRAIRNLALTLGLGVMLVGSTAASSGFFAQSQPATGVQEKSRTRRVSDSPSASPTPPAVPKEEESDEVVRVETNLTNIFFTAAY